jgi:hypothetical protein
MKFAARPALGGESRTRRMRGNLRLKVPRLQPQPARDDEIAVVGYGPSLRQTWRGLKDFKWICTTSGAHDFLLDRGITPNFHVEFDPRPHKCAFLTRPTQTTTYCLASTCHPKMYRQVRKAGSSVLMWHPLGVDLGGDARAVHAQEDEGVLVFGGSTAGLRSLTVMHVLGFRKFALFGLDCSYAEDVTWAGPHSGDQHQSFYVTVNDRRFRTSDIMLNAAEEMWHTMQQWMNDSAFVVVGDHLFAERCDLFRKTGGRDGFWWYPDGWELEYQRDEKSLPLAPHLDPLISDAYRNINALCHQEIAEYGSFGARHAPGVKDLLKRYDCATILDYGCGKRALQTALGFPIANYDPAIPGLDVAHPADLVVCTDVLEHVEPEKIEAVLRHIASLARKAVFIEISTALSTKRLPDGRNMHLTVEPPEWWRKRVEGHFTIVEQAESDRQFLCICLPKKESFEEAA